MRKQAQATKYIKDLLASRQLEINPGLVLIGEDQPWQVFEHNNKCIGIDPNSGVWTGLKGEKWECISETCDVSGALQAIEFLTENSLPQMK
jgi:hypothetical protein